MSCTEAELWNLLSIETLCCWLSVQVHTAVLMALLNAFRVLKDLML